LTGVRHWWLLQAVFGQKIINQLATKYVTNNYDSAMGSFQYQWGRTSAVLRVIALV